MKPPDTAAQPPSMAIPHDFPDRLSPILVKELRQGLRQPTFVIAFLCLQVLLCIVVLVAALSAPAGSRAGSEAGSVVSGFFFVLLGITILVAQPLRALNALASEMKADTLDLLLLTRLNAWRITFGKWLALVSQSALLVVAVLPYLILRYYLGGMQLFSELLGLALMFAISASLTGVMVGFSATSSVLLRGLVGAGLMALLVVFMGESRMLRVLFGGSGDIFFNAPSTAAEIKAFACLILMMVFFGYYFLEMGATSIAPAAENRSTLKRLAGIGMLGMLPWLTEDPGEMRFFCWLLVVALLVMDAVSEHPDFTASVLRPFHRLGPLRRPLGMLLLPGWPCGVFYAGVLIALTLVLAMTGELLEGSGRIFYESITLAALWSASLLFPAAIRVWFLPKVRNPFAAYIVILLGMLVVGLVLFIIAAATNTEEALVWVIPFCPVCGIMAFSEARFLDHNDTAFLLALVSTGVYWVAIYLRSQPHRRRAEALDRELIRQAATPVPPHAA